MEQVLERSAATATGEDLLSYYTSQPAPTQWVAVGVLSGGPRGHAERRVRLVVGTGRTEADAVAAFERRVRDTLRG